MKTFSAQVIFLTIMLLVVLFLAAILPPHWKNVDGFQSYTSSTSTDFKPMDTLNTNIMGEEQPCVNTVGGLHCKGGDDATVGQIDKFYGFPSDMNCQASGLTKSNGNVCLDNVTTQLLTSRGGNFSWSEYK
jgi:hypothetical protein